MKEHGRERGQLYTFNINLLAEPKHVHSISVVDVAVSGYTICCQ